ncbi:MAG: class I SAM-dependent methyltransferase [Planctomycetota bacterium]
MTLDPHRVAIERNRHAWNDLAASGAALTRAASDADFASPADAVDPQRWLRERIDGGLHGRRVLCLAAGGGRQGPLFAAAGAVVTVVDLSDAMLARDRAVANDRGLSLTILRASMDDLGELADGAFDIVAQPVSTCYVPSVTPVYAEVSRVLRSGGLYLSQHKSPTSLQANPRATEAGVFLRTSYYTDRPLPEASPCRTREPGTVEHLHRWEDLLGGMCRAGMAIEALSEPSHADEPGEHGRRSRYVAPYVRVLARKHV